MVGRCWSRKTRATGAQGKWRVACCLRAVGVRRGQKGGYLTLPTAEAHDTLPAAAETEAQAGPRSTFPACDTAPGRPRKATKRKSPPPPRKTQRCDGTQNHEAQKARKRPPPPRKTTKRKRRAKSHTAINAATQPGMWPQKQACGASDYYCWHPWPLPPSRRMSRSRSRSRSSSYACFRRCHGDFLAALKGAKRGDKERERWRSSEDIGLHRGSHAPR